MAAFRKSLASAKTRDLLASLDAHVLGKNGEEILLDEAEQAEEAPSSSSLNDSEANNLSFIISARVSRTSDCLTSLENADANDSSDIDYAKLSERIAQRLDELSERLIDDKGGMLTK